MSHGVYVGDTVLLRKKRLGLVRYFGKTYFSTGYWFGIELIDSSLTRHNGMILNKRYFKCPSNKGLFVRRERIKKVISRNDVQQLQKNRTHSITLKLKRKRKRQRVPKYKIEKENERLQSLALMASRNKPIAPILNRKHHRYQQHLDIIPIERIPNELLSDNESIEISSKDAIIIERNLINYGDKECNDALMDNFIRDLNDIEYSLSVEVQSDHHLSDINNKKPNENKGKIPNYNDYEIQNPMFPIEGDEETFFEEENKQIQDRYASYLLINYGLFPCLVYSSINALIVFCLYLFFNGFSMQFHWRTDLHINEWIHSDWTYVPSLLSVDLLVTTVIESISIWFFITMLVQKDLRKGTISRLDLKLNDICCNCFLSNHNKSLCKRCVRNMVCAIVWMIFTVIVFYVPIAFVLPRNMNENYMMNLDYIQMMIFKASYSGVMAFVVSPLTACFTLL